MATDNVFTWRGKTVAANDKQAVVTLFMDAAKELEETVVPMSVEQAYAILSSIQGKSDKINIARLKALIAAQPQTIDDRSQATVKDATLEEQNDTILERTTTNMSAFEGNEDAYTFGLRIDSRTIAHLEDTADAKEELDGAPLIIATDLLETFTVSEIIRMPKPSSRWDREPYKSRLINDEPDHYVVKNHNSGKEHKGSYFDDMFFATSMAKGLLRTRALAKKIIDNSPLTEGEKSELTRLIKPLKISAAELEGKHKALSVKKWVDARYNAALAKFRRAISFIQQKHALEEIPGMTLYMVDGDIEVSAKKRDPIWIEFRPTTKGAPPVPGDAISLGTFIKYDLRQAKIDALANGVPCTLAHILATTARKSKDGKNATGKSEEARANSTLATNVHEFTDHVLSARAFVDGKDRFAMILDQCNKDPQLLEAIGDLSEAIDGIMPKIDVRYRTMKANAAMIQEGMAVQDKGKAA